MHVVQESEQERESEEIMRINQTLSLLPSYLNDVQRALMVAAATAAVMEAAEDWENEIE